MERFVTMCFKSSLKNAKMEHSLLYVYVNVKRCVFIRKESLGTRYEKAPLVDCVSLMYFFLPEEFFLLNYFAHCNLTQILTSSPASDYGNACSCHEKSPDQHPSRESKRLSVSDVFLFDIFNPAELINRRVRLYRFIAEALSLCFLSLTRNLNSTIFPIVFLNEVSVGRRI